MRPWTRTVSISGDRLSTTSGRALKDEHGRPKTRRLIGLAVGDALGQAVEFKSPGSFSEVTGYRGGGPFGLLPGEWTDDTSMALALGHSLTEAGWNLDDQMQRYLSWYERGTYSVNGRCFDIGTTTSQALRAYKHSGDARNSADSSSRSSGNGSIMRLAPVPIAFAGLFPDDLDTLVEHLVESSLTTHASPQCLHATAYFGLVLAGLINGLPREAVLDPSWPPLKRLAGLHDLHPEVSNVAQGSYRGKQPPEIRGSGYVVKSLEAALWAFHDARRLRGSRAPRGQSGRRCRHHGRHLRPARRRLLGRVGHPSRVAGRAWRVAT